MCYCKHFKSALPLQMTDMTGAGIEVGVVEDTAEVQDLDNLGVKAIGNVTDAEPTTLQPGDAVMHVEQIKPLSGGATETEEIGVMATAGAAGVVMAIVVVVVVEGVIEELLHSSLETGIAQTAAPTILQADKHATSAVLTSEHCPMHMLCQELLCQTLCRLAGLVLAALSAWLWVQLGCSWCWCPSLGFGCAGWLLGSWLNCLGCGVSSGFPCWLWQGMEWCDRLAAGCSGSCFFGKCLDSASLLCCTGPLSKCRHCPTERCNCRHHQLVLQLSSFNTCPGKGSQFLLDCINDILSNSSELISQPVMCLALDWSQFVNHYLSLSPQLSESSVYQNAQMLADDTRSNATLERRGRQ